MGDVISMKTSKPVVIKKQTAIIGVQKVIKQKKEPKRKEVNNPLTEEHRNDINYLVRYWSDTSKQAMSKKNHIEYWQAWNNLYSYGLNDEVNGIEQIEESEYPQCQSYLNQRIRIAESKVPKKILGSPVESSDWIMV